MAKQTITQSLIDKARRDARPGQPRYEIRDARSAGLILRVGPSGAMWQFRFGVSSRDIRLTLGSIDTWTLSEARQLIAKGRAMLDGKLGIPDENWVARQQKTAGKIAEATLAPAPEKPRDLFRWTFQQGRDAWLADARRTLSPITAADYRQKASASEFDGLLKRPLPSITRAEMAAIVAKIHRSGRETHAANTARTISAMWGWLERDENADNAGTTPGIMKGLKAPERTRRPSPRLVADPTLEDLGRIIAIARSKAVDPIIGCAVELVVWSVQRRRAVAAAKLEDFRELDDGERGLWYVYADDRKRNNGEAHIVPLPAPAWACVQRAMRILETDYYRRLDADRNAARPDYLFPQARPRARGMAVSHIHESTLTHTLGFFPGVKSSPHHVRHIIGTYGERMLGFSRASTKMILDHSEGGLRSDVTGKHYALHSGEHEKWPVMEKWCDAVEAEVMAATMALEPVDKIRAAIAAARYGDDEGLRQAAE